MRDHDNGVDRRLSGPLLTRFVVGLLCCLALWTALDLQFQLAPAREGTLTDFDAFYIVGQMFWEGRVADAYRFEAMVQAQQSYRGADSFMPWSYPPHFNLVPAGLSLLPIGPAYLLFVSATLLAYCVALRRISGAHFGAVLLAIFPALAVTIRTGQNGFLTGALVGFFVLCFCSGNVRAGVPLGLLVIKPHLGLGVSLYAVLARRWSVLATAAATASLLTFTAQIAFGAGIWGAFLQGAQEAKTFLGLGLYPMYRMVSVYSGLYTAGLPGAAAFAVQIGCAIGFVLLIGLAHRLRWPRRHVLALAVLSPVYVSPYIYDYDLMLLGVAAALVLPELSRHASHREFALLFGLCWISSGWGTLGIALEQVGAGTEAELRSVSILAISGMTACAANVLRRGRVRRRPSEPACVGLVVAQAVSGNTVAPVRGRD